MRTIITIVVVIITAVACNDSTTNTNTNNNTNNNTNYEICNDNIDNDFDGDIDCNDFDCRYTTACTVGVCGNGAIEAGEECDGGNFDGKSCQVFGYQSGQLSCTADCTIDVEGCENPDPLKIMQSGGRIKMRVGRAAAPDGSVSFNGWYDTQLGINCVWRKAAADGGVSHCLPERVLRKRYTDDRCTNQTIVIAETGDSALTQNTFASVYSGDELYTPVRVAGSYTGAVYEKVSSDLCSYSGSAISGAYWSEAVPAQQFQAQLETIE